MSSSQPATYPARAVTIPNFRDAGDGIHVRQGLVYRAADPTKAAAQSLQIMANDLGTAHIRRFELGADRIGIKVVFDLRSCYEVEKHRPNGTSDNYFEIPFSDFGMKRQWTPVFEQLDFSPDKVPRRYLNYTMPGSEGYVNAYRNILESAPPAFTSIFEHLSQPHPAPCVVHCTVGKDRTGVLVALLLMLAGVSRENIGLEYSLTDAGLEAVKPVYLQRLMEREEFQNNPEGAIRLLSARKENMEATVDMIHQDFGGAEGYMRGYCSMSGAMIEQLRRNLQVPPLSEQ